MALDPSIALGVKPLELPNQLAQYGQVQQIQANQMKMQEAQAANEERNALRQLNPANADYENQLFKVNPQLGIQYRKERTAAEASTAATAQHKMTAADTRQKMDSQAWRDISNRPSDANIIAHTEDVQDSTLHSPQEKQIVAKRAQMLLDMPFEERKTFLEAQGATAGDYSSRANNAATVDATIRGQNLVDARARERLAAESATGVLTPQSLDVAANVYLQTGQLPVGQGKASAAVRSQVMNRATELSTGTPAADVAGNIVGAKLDVASRGKAIKDFSTGIQGRQVNAFNTAIDHLGTMDKLSDALANGDLKAINAVGNVIARQTGQPAPTNFDAAKQIVTAEVIKAVVASGGGVTERQEAERNFAAASSPEQLKGVINTYKQLLGGQLKSLGLQYENTTGRKDFDNKLTGDAKAELQKLRGGEAKPAPVAMQAQDTQALEWANANPKDPRAAAIKQRLGL
jgi:hypothetical protein